MQAESRPHPHDIAFSGLSRSQDDVFFVQIGAADGRRFDPIHPFVRRYGWRGVLVEPLADLFELLKDNYSGQPGLSFENAAITERAETRVISRVPLDRAGEGDVPGWAFGASTLVPRKTRFARHNSPAKLHAALNSAAVEEEVRCMSLAMLLDKHGVETIDVLQLDTEGYDARILRQLDFDEHRPAIINMEWQWLDEAERNEVGSRLRGEGYSLYGCEADLLATARPLAEFVVPAAEPDPDAVPRFFPGILRFAVQTGIDQETGASLRPAARIEFRRARGTRLPIPGQPALAAFLARVDSHRSYRQIAEETGCGIDEALRWGSHLQSLYVIE